MNERVIIVGEMQKNDDPDTKYLAHWANDAIIHLGRTPEEAIGNLFAERYPTIWHLNDTDPIAETLIKTEVGKLGVCKEYYNRREGHEIGEEEDGR